MHGGVAGYWPAALMGDSGDVPVNWWRWTAEAVSGQALDEQLQLSGEPPGSPVGSLAAGQPGQAASAVTGRPPLQRPGSDSAMPSQPREWHAVFDVRTQNLPAGHRLVPLRLGQAGQVPGIAAGHLSSVTASRFPMPRGDRLETLAEIGTGTPLGWCPPAGCRRLRRRCR